MAHESNPYVIEGQMTPEELADECRATLKQNGIESPDISQMWHIKRSDADYYFRSYEKYKHAKYIFERQDHLKAKLTDRFAIDDQENNMLQWINENNITCNDCAYLAYNPTNRIHCSNPDVSNIQTYKKSTACKRFTFKKE